MPFNPPESQNLLPLLLKHTLNQRSQDESRRYAEEEERKQLRRQEQMQLLEFAQDPDFKLDSIAPIFENIGPEDLNFAREIQKSRKKQKTEAASAQAAFSSAPQLSALGAPMLGPRGERLPSPQMDLVQQQREQALATLRATRPELVPIFEQQLALGQAGGERALQETQATQQFAQTQARQEKGEQRQYARGQELLDSASQGIAEEIASGSYRGQDAWTEDLATRAGLPKHTAERLISEATFRARGMASTIAREERGAQGKRPDVAARDAEVAAILEQYPDADPVKLERDVTRQLSGTAVRDPLLEQMLGRPSFVSVVGEKEGRELRERRRALIGVREQYDTLRGSFEALREGVKSGKINAGALRTASYFDALNLAGLQPAEVAAYRTSSFLYAASILKATQGTRPSDFDFKNYLALVPQMTEVMSGSADAKLDALDNLIRIQTLSEVDPASRKIANQLRKPDSPADRKARSQVASLAAQMDAAVESGNQAEIDRVTGEFYKTAQKWRSSPGATVPQNVESQDLSPEELKLLGPP